jgi:argininosuccinate lyase
MLYEQRIITKEHAAAILKALLELEKMKLHKDFVLDPYKGDFYFNIETYVISRAGEEAGGRLQIGRSRIDVNRATRTYAARTGLLEIILQLLDLQETLLGFVEEHADTIMPGYTHLQLAQPTTYGHYILGFHDSLTRDLKRLWGAYDNNNLNVLGTAAGAGTTWPLSRERTTELLGFDDLMECSSDACLNQDEKIEIATACAILMNTICRRAIDYYMWTTYEFNLVELDPSFAGTSSIMPQKKNPYPFELLRCKSSAVLGDMVQSFDLLKTDTSGFPDYAYVGPGVMARILHNTRDVLTFMIPVLKTLEIKKDEMKARANAGFATAVDLVDEIVQKKNMPFRTAHLVVGRLVKLALERGMPQSEVGAKLLDEAAGQILGEPLGLSDEVVKRALDAEMFLKARTIRGGPAPSEVRRMLGLRRKSFENEREKFKQKEPKIKNALEKMHKKAQEIIG